MTAEESEGAAARQIPVVVLSGFLGAGKTTVLNHLLHSSRGSRIAVLVNDFGSIEIDAMAVAGQAGSTVSLGNGCLCCAVDVSELDEQLARLTAPGLRVDLVVIEASGLAEPAELVRMVLAGDNPRLVYGGLVEVVDAAEFPATRARHPGLGTRLAVADLVVLNKTDRITGAERAALLAEVRGLARGAAVVPVTHGRLDPELLFDRRPVTERRGQLSFDDLRAEEEPAPHLHEGYESVARSYETPLDPVRLMSFLEGRPDGLYRIKGYVDFGAADPLHRYGVHAVGRFLGFVPEPWPEGAPRRTELVLIGAGIDAGRVAVALDACREEELAAAPDALTLAGGADADGQRRMWGVLRYVRDPEADLGDGTGPEHEPEPPHERDPDPDPESDPGAESRAGLAF